MSYGDSYSAVQSADLTEQAARHSALENSLRSLYANLANLGQTVRSVAGMAQQQSQFDKNLDYSNRALKQQDASAKRRDYLEMRRLQTGGTALKRDLPLKTIQQEIEVGDPQDALESYHASLDPETFTVLKRAKTARRAEIDSQHRELELAADVLNQERTLTDKLKKNTAIKGEIGNSRTLMQKLTPNWLVPDSGPDINTTISTENTLIDRQLQRMRPLADAIRANKNVAPLLTVDSKTMRYMPAVQKPSWLNHPSEQTGGTESTGAPARELNVSKGRYGTVSSPKVAAPATSTTTNVVRIKTSDGNIWRVPADKAREALSRDPGATLIQ